MSRNLIVTCGTSQIEERKLNCIINVALREMSSLQERREARRKLDPLKDYAKEVLEATSEGISDNYFQQVIGKSSQAGGNPTEQEEHCQTLINALVNQWPNIDNVIGAKYNPFGAEISTLAKMEKQGPRRRENPDEFEPPVFNPQQDEIVLLYSGTRPGGFCAGVLYKLLTHSDTLAMPPNRVETQRLAELREEPRNVTRAEKEVEEALLGNRKEQGEIQNLFVMTGGFKSIIPALTVYALIYGDDIYYLFERSKELRRLSLPGEVKSESKGRWWHFWRRQSIDGSKRIVTIEVDTGTGEPPTPPPDPPIL